VCGREEGREREREGGGGGARRKEGQREAHRDTNRGREGGRVCVCKVFQKGNLLRVNLYLERERERERERGMRRQS